MLIKSKIDGKEYSFLDFKKHLAVNKITHKDYCLNLYKKQCLSSGQPIPFKNLEQYLGCDFIDKNAMKKWYKDNPELAKDYSIKLIEQRKQTKGIKYALCEIELRSLGFPRAKYYKSIKGGYPSINSSLGLEQRFDYEQEELIIRDNLVKYEVICDTREQKEIKFSRAKIEKLDYGDYSCSKKPKLAIERKSLKDLISSLGIKDNFERFEREVERAVADNGYIVVLCEEDINTGLSFDYLPHIKRYTKITPSILFHNIRALIQKYSNIQFAFCKDRKHMAEVMEKIFLCENDISKVDLQYLISEKKL